ncbi:MAG: serine hydrolase [Rhodospirillaceae bacterium]|nr:serine hydrolase [Rhodospirillaceae bacterium]
MSGLRVAASARFFIAAAAACLTASCARGEAEEFDHANLSGLTASTESNLYRRIEAVIVEQDGAILYERYFGDTTPETRIDARSAGKSITALAVGIAIDRDDIESLDAPVYRFFSDRAPFADDGPLKNSITVRDLLSMSSALDCDDWRDSPGNEEKMYETPDWSRFALDIPTAKNYARGAGGFGRFSYCTAGAFLLGRIVERASGQPFENFVQSSIFEHLRITNPVWKRAPNGEVQSGGQLSLRARDFLALGRLVRDGGVIGSRKIVSQAWLSEMLAPHLRATSDEDYGYLWWRRTFQSVKTGHVGHYMSGNGGNKVVVLPSLRAVVVILSTNYNQKNMHQQTTEILEKHILPALEALEPGTPRAAPSP